MDIFKSWLVEQYIAHRGFHNNEAPENSLKAFENAIEKNYAIELDVHIIADDTLIVFHDDNLKRVTNRDGYVKNLKKEDLKDIHLNSTQYCIPTFEEVLKLVDGRVPILIEIKNIERVGKLESLLLNMLKNYKGEYAVQSFNPYSLEYFKTNAPEILRGQLAGYFKNVNLSFLKRFVLKRMLLNKKVSCPNFISYEAEKLPNRYVKRYMQIPILAWTIRSQEQYEKTLKHCDNIIFEGFEPRI